MTIAATTDIGWLLRTEVRGTPIAQGAIRSLGKGRPSIHANAERLLPWRERIQLAVQAAMADSSAVTWPFCGPVAVHLTFTMKKPTSAPKRKKTWPISRPDVDKLARAVLDALVNAGALRDDSQVITLSAHKTFPSESALALPMPGLSLTLSPLS